MHHIKQKPQITYLDNYFNHFRNNRKVFENLKWSSALVSCTLLDYQYQREFLKKINNIVFIYENEYIDQHYLEDYAAYYVRCFNAYEKNCSRIHFFRTNSCSSKYKRELHQAMNDEPSIFNNENYLGFIVIRPIPQTFLAKVCLKPYSGNQKLLLKDYKVSLFGIDLEIASVAFQEQDRILSACATTSLWSFFHAHPNMNVSQLPSSSAITSSAYPEHNGYDREFPNTGLSTDMICRSLRAHNLTPEYFEFAKKDDGPNEATIRIELFKEYIYSYSSSGLPLILGVSVHNSEITEEKGLHAVAILGYSINKELDDQKITAHRLEKIYVHDDRYGPFFKIDINNDKCNVTLDPNKEVTNNSGSDNEVYIPDTLTIGIYHKIRINYISIKNTCLMFNELLYKYLHEENSSVAELFNSFEWDIRIKQNSELKKDLIKSDITDKERYLTKSYPKYIWSAKASSLNIDMFELLFDATDIEQGDVFLDILAINNEYSRDIIEIIESYCSKNFHYKVENDSSINGTNNFMWGIIKYFKKQYQYKDTLADLFGYLKIPKRIKKEEIDGNDLVIDHAAVKLDRKDNTYMLDKTSQESYIYIWVIDKEGFLCIGKEYNGTSQGHPTLTSGMPARIGGELKLCEENWEINAFSGRYSSEYTNQEKMIFLENAIQYKFKPYFPNEEFFFNKSLLA